MLCHSMQKVTMDKKTIIHCPYYCIYISSRLPCLFIFKLFSMNAFVQCVGNEIKPRMRIYVPRPEMYCNGLMLFDRDSSLLQTFMEMTMILLPLGRVTIRQSGEPGSYMGFHPTLVRSDVDSIAVGMSGRFVVLTCQLVIAYTLG